MVQDGGMIYGVQCGEQSLEGNGRAERGWCGVADEVERDGGIEHVIDFRSLNGAFGVSVRDAVFKIMRREWSKKNSGILWSCGVKSCVARRRHVND